MDRNTRTVRSRVTYVFLCSDFHENLKKKENEKCINISRLLPVTNCIPVGL